MRSAAGVLLGSVILLAGSWVEAGCLHRLHGCCNRCGTQQIVVHVCKSGGSAARTESAPAPESAQQAVAYSPTRIVESYPVMQPVMQMASYAPMMMPQMVHQVPQMVVQSPPARTESAPAPKDSCDCDRISARLDKLETDMDRMVDLIGKHSQAIERIAAMLNDKNDSEGESPKN